ncbi:hypothetical protein COB21_05885, partial [Candidatus Aerophobetes bacterium]
GSNVNRQIHVYTFGGAKMIPNSLAERVHNFMFDQDIISRWGNKLHAHTAGTQYAHLRKIQNAAIRHIRTSPKKSLYQPTDIPELQPHRQTDDFTYYLQAHTVTIVRRDSSPLFYGICNLLTNLHSMASYAPALLPRIATQELQELCTRRAQELRTRRIRAKDTKLQELCTSRAKVTVLKTAPLPDRAVPIKTQIITVLTYVLWKMPVVAAVVAGVIYQEVTVGNIAQYALTVFNQSQTVE